MVLFYINSLSSLTATEIYVKQNEEKINKKLILGIKKGFFFLKKVVIKKVKGFRCAIKNDLRNECVGILLQFTSITCV